MDIKTIFRNILSDQFIPDFDYVNCKFSFQTVFYRTYYSYSCCSCGFEHEFLDYLAESGEINEILLDKIVECVIKGKCPHVNNGVPDEFLRETSVHAIHIAAAVGMKEAIFYHINHFRKITSGIFGLEPHITAALKNRHKYVDVYTRNEIMAQHGRCHGSFLLYAVRSNTTQSKQLVNLQRFSLLEFCVEMKSIELLKTILSPAVSHSNMHRACEMAMKHNSDELLEALIEYDKRSLEYRGEMFKSTRREGSHSALPAIVCNRPEILDRVLDFVPTYKLHDVYKSMLRDTCDVLQRRACQEVLEKHGISNTTSEISSRNQVAQLLHLFTFYKDYREEIKRKIRDIPNLFQAINSLNSEAKYSFQSVSMMGLLHSYIYENEILDPTVVEAMLELGVDVDVTDVHGNSPLIHLLEQKPPYCLGFRESLELLIYENPSAYLNRAAVFLALKQDAKAKTWNLRLFNMTGKFVMDAQLHSLFGHDDSYTYAMNFTGPLLIESGFPVTRESIFRALNEPLHPSYLAYLKDYLDEPRSLQLNCRDVLRKHFRGRSLHVFIEAADIPNRIRNFILMKSLLLSI